MRFRQYIQSRPYQERISIIFRVARKQKGLSVREMSLFLGLNGSLYQEWEEGTGTPDFLEWAQFCDRLDLDLDSCRWGYIDRGAPIQLKTAGNSGIFKLPPRYLSHQSTSNRWLFPIVEFLRFRMGKEEFFKFCETMGVDADYFYEGDQKLNFKLTQDILGELMKYKPTSSTARTIVDVAFSELRSDWLHRTTERHSNYTSLFMDLNNFNRYFDMDFSYEWVETLEDGFYFCATASDWIKSDINDMDSKTKNWYHRYKAEWFRNFILASSQLETSVEIIELDDKKDPDCLFRVQIA
jgi:transcriptional regulator with XRE-family HTH domain